MKRALQWGHQLQQRNGYGVVQCVCVFNHTPCVSVVTCCRPLPIEVFMIDLYLIHFCFLKGGDGNCNHKVLSASTNIGHSTNCDDVAGKVSANSTQVHCVCKRAHTLILPCFLSLSHSLSQLTGRHFYVGGHGFTFPSKQLSVHLCLDQLYQFPLLCFPKLLR